MGYEMIELTKDGGVATIKLDRPKALNALCGPMMAEVANALACLLYTSPSPRDKRQSRMPSSA